MATATIGSGLFALHEALKSTREIVNNIFTYQESVLSTASLFHFLRNLALQIIVRLSWHLKNSRLMETSGVVFRFEMRKAHSGDKKPKKCSEIVIDPSSLLDESTALAVLEIVAGSESFCLWTNGELQYQAAAEEKYCDFPPDSIPIVSSTGRLSISKGHYEVRSLSTSTSPISSRFLAEDMPMSGVQAVSAAKSLELKVKKTFEQDFGGKVLQPNEPCLQPRDATEKTGEHFIDLNNAKEAAGESFQRRGSPFIAHGLYDSDAPFERKMHKSQEPAVSAVLRRPEGRRTRSEESPSIHNEKVIGLASQFTNDPAAGVSNPAPIPDFMTNGHVEMKHRATPAPGSATLPMRLDHILQASGGPPTPPPIGPAAATLEPAPPDQQHEIRQLNDRCLIKIGKKISTAGIKLRRKNTPEQYLTVSTHAAFDGLNSVPLPVGFMKKSFKNLFKSHRTPQPIESKPVHEYVVNAGQSIESGREAEVIGNICRFKSAAYDDCPKADTECPLFPNDFQHNISFVGPLLGRKVCLNQERKALKWRKTDKIEGVNVKILGHAANGVSFTPVGAMYARCRTKDKFEVDKMLIQRSVLFIRDDDPLEPNHVLSGAPVVAESLVNETNSEGGVTLARRFDQLLGFTAFQFAPLEGRAESLSMAKHHPQQLQNRYLNGQLTFCGAIIPNKDFKREWEIVQWDE